MTDDIRDMILTWAGRVHECQECDEDWPCAYHVAELDIILSNFEDHDDT